jgi:hypothetical protein
MAEVKVLIDLKELDVMLNRAIVAGIHLQQINKWPAGLSPLPDNFREARDEQREDLLQYHHIPRRRA